MVILQAKQKQRLLRSLKRSEDLYQNDGMPFLQGLIEFKSLLEAELEASFYSKKNPLTSASK